LTGSRGKIQIAKTKLAAELAELRRDSKLAKWLIKNTHRYHLTQHLNGKWAAIKNDGEGDRYPYKGEWFDTPYAAMEAANGETDS